MFTPQLAQIPLNIGDKLNLRESGVTYLFLNGFDQTLFELLICKSNELNQLNREE